MWAKSYAISVGLITLAILAIGGLLWSSGTVELKPDSGSTVGALWYRGADDAPVTIDAYPDFECGICVEKESLVVQALADYPGRVRVVYHHYADSGFSETLAEALEAAGEQGKFWEMHDRFVQNVPADMAVLKAVAREVGLNTERFIEALDSGKFTAKVQLAKQEAISAGVQYVAVFINGREYPKSPGTLEDLYDAIDEELERLGTDVTE
jgi:protein-disulfide isomerase